MCTDKRTRRAKARAALIGAGIIGLLGAAPAAAARAPGAVAVAPSPAASRAPRSAAGERVFTTKVSVPNRPVGRVAAADCAPRTSAISSASSTLGPNGASTSRTIVAVPLRGGSVPAATLAQRTAEACR